MLRKRSFIAFAFFPDACKYILCNKIICIFEISSVRFRIFAQMLYGSYNSTCNALKHSRRLICSFFKAFIAGGLFYFIAFKSFLPRLPHRFRHKKAQGFYLTLSRFYAFFIWCRKFCLPRLRVRERCSLRR